MSMSFVTPVRPAPAPPVPMREGIEIEGPRVGFARDAEIFGEGEPADWVYRVVSGAVRTCRLLSDGRRQIEEFYFPGDCFGLEADLERGATAEALTDTVLTAVKRSTLADRAQRDADVARRLWRMTAHELKRTQDHILMLGRRSAVERLAGFLLELAERNGTRDTVELPMSRQDIADYLGLTIETVSRTFTQLQGSGLIEIPACRRIRLRDRAALAELCD
jgi:CRP/FNR family nitrogen fixation transcriptional regulator